MDFHFSDAFFFELEELLEGDPEVFTRHVDYEDGLNELLDHEEHKAVWIYNQI